MKVLVLGHKGMLGNAVYKYLRKKQVVLCTTTLRWPNEDFKEFVKNCDCDFVINCIGSIPQRKDSFDVNHELPKWLDANIAMNLIHPGTDCEVDTDEYGVSKKKAVDYILEKGLNTKVIKTSIIGHELNSSASLLDWFLNQKDQVNGYNNHYWNGNTTLQWSKTCYDILNDWDSYDKMTILATKAVSKYELLKTISNVYNKKIIIKSFEHEKTVNNKCLVGNVSVPDIESQLIELKNFYSKGGK